MKYDHKKIEKKWQEKWYGEWRALFEAADFSSKPKYYFLVEFPYPSGEGLHMGHPRSYVALDIVARKRRMEGFNVLYPIGWDAFGLPAENYAIKTGEHPRVTTQKNIANFRRQLKAIGLSFDWSREVDTTDPSYYKWTQWLFLQFFKHGLAYKSKMPINWCLSCKIGLANEEVLVDGRCERCGESVEKRDKEQWMIAITRYADKLLAGLEMIDYLPRIKQQQIDWIGKSEGALIDFDIEGELFKNIKIKVFTTRPDTLFGATYLVLAPEHPFISRLTVTEQQKAVLEYQRHARMKSELERTELQKEKTGVPTGSYAINPANGERIPIWIADYVLGNYGTGAIMAVPAHDERDCEFSKKYDLPIREVVRGGELPYIDNGILVNSGKFDGLNNETAKQKITEFVGGRKKIHYKLRDWVFSRQRYWGEPIPIIHCGKCGAVPVPDDELPVLLPEVEKYQPTDTGESPLATISEWVNVKCPTCGGAAKRETDVMPNWAGSSWYFLRYCDPKNKKAFADKDKLKYWMPIDWYNGGMEHTTLHLLYSRFWNLFFYDIGLVPAAEPYKKRTSHGLILAEDGEKMSKSRGNVVNPDDIIKEYGADALRCYEMFIGPFDQPVPWSPQGVVGVRRFLERVTGLPHKVKPRIKNRELSRTVHQTVKKVTEDIEAMKFNTAVSQMMICVKVMEDAEVIPQNLFELFLKMLSGFAPHLAEELWAAWGHTESIFKESWPAYDSTLAKESEIELVVQVNGKVRDRFTVPADLPEAELQSRALASSKIKEWTRDKKIVNILVVRGKLVNIVIE